MSQSYVNGTWLKLLPGNSGTVGRPPVAIKICFALYTCLPSTITFPSEVNDALPRINSTSACRKICAVVHVTL